MENLKSPSTTRNKKLVVLTGGGTGGHIYPNLALAKEFEKRGFAVAYIGGENGMEKQLAHDNGIAFYGVPTIKLIRSFSPKACKNNIAIPAVLHKSILQAIDILNGLNPCAVFSKGGFACLPCVLGASKLKIPVFAHESDASLGLANRIAKLKGATILKANPNAEFDGLFVGMPLRETLFHVSKQQALNTLNVHTNKPILLVLGGSLGAQAINDAIKKHFDWLCQNFFVLHVYGKGKKDNLANKNYLGFEYANDVSLFYACADMVISRAGATAVFELSSLNKKALFIPLPKGVSRGDQIDNANLAKEYGGHILLQDENFFDNFRDSVQKTLKYPPMTCICANANGKIVDAVCDRLQRGEKCKDKKLSQNGLP